MSRDLLEGVTGYEGLFLICAVSGIAIPIPEDVPLMVAGMRIEAGELAWGPTLAVAFVGVLVRDLVAYGAGRLVGNWLLERPWVQRAVGRRRLARARAMVEAHGAGAVLAGRFLVGMRAPIFLVAGAGGVSLRRFLLWDTLGLLLAVPLAVGLGHAFGAPLVEGAMWVITRYRLALVVGLVVAAGWWWTRLRAARDEASDVTLPAEQRVR